jgi:hypothetical protein
MAYLDNSVVTVNAILTKKGREILAQRGALNITSFALSDDEIDYRLYDPNHPKGSAFYDVALRNTPIFEPFSDESQVLKYKLVTLPAGSTAIPVINVGQELINVKSTFRGETVIVPSTNPTFNTKLGYTAILANKNAGTVIGEGLDASVQATIPSFLGDVSSETAQVATGLRFRFIPNNALSSTLNTTLTIIGNESGGSKTIDVTVKVVGSS